jgi:hypothetical protein
MQPGQGDQQRGAKTKRPVRAAEMGDGHLSLVPSVTPYQSLRTQPYHGTHIVETEAQIQKAIEALKSGEVKSLHVTTKFCSLYLRTLIYYLNESLSYF